jgi:hypothetical protein
VRNPKGAVVAAVLVGLNFVLVGLGCSSTETTRRRTRPTTSATPTASSTARISLTGDVGLTGAATDPSVRCNFPDLEGLGIAVLAQPPDSALLARIRLAPSTVKVVVSSGSGPDYHERAFEGTGVTSFDAATGAVVDSTLTETAARAGSSSGSLGAITGIKGSVECGDQTAGTSTVTIMGDTAEGALAGAVLDPVRVECAESPDGDEVIALGLMQVGSTKALVKLGLTSDGAVTVDETLPSVSHRFMAGGSSTITSSGARVRADVVEQEVATPAPTLHVEGDLSCGLHAAG